PREHGIGGSGEAIGVDLDLERRAGARLTSHGMPDRRWGSRRGVLHGALQGLWGTLDRRRCSSMRSTKGTRTSARPCWSRARNALRAGFPVTVTNRTLERAKPLGEAGATIARTPREVAERSDIVVTMVTNTPDVEAVIFGPEGVAAGAHDGLLAIDMSTVSP